MSRGCKSSAPFHVLSSLAQSSPCFCSKRAPDFDVDAVAKFIETYIKEDRTNATSIDRVGEYLKEEDLSHPSVGVLIIVKTTGAGSVSRMCKSSPGSAP